MPHLTGALTAQEAELKARAAQLALIKSRLEVEETEARQRLVAQDKVCSCQQALGWGEPLGHS